MPPEIYRAFGFPGAEGLANMFQFKRDLEDYYCGARSLETSRELNPQLQTFEQLLARNKARIPWRRWHRADSLSATSGT